MPIGCDLPGPDFPGFYSALGMALLGTVCDGDCGLDVCCQMLGRLQTLEERQKLREEISDYLLARVDVPWMQDAMAACQEIRSEDLAVARSGASSPAAPAAVAAAVAPQLIVIDAPEGSAPLPELPPPPPDLPPACALEAPPPLPPPNEPPPNTAGCIPRSSGESPDDAAMPVVPGIAATEHVDAAIITSAIAWATGVNKNDKGLLNSIIEGLPIAVQHEQVHKYLAAKDAQEAAVVAAADAKPTRIVVQAGSLKSRMQVAEALHKELTRIGWVRGKRVPRHAIQDFIEDNLLWEAAPLCKRGKQIQIGVQRRKLLSNWHGAWLLATGGGKHAPVGVGRTTAKRVRKVEFTKRKRAVGAGAHVACPWVRQELYEWFVRIRYSVDWRAVSRIYGGKTCLGRFARKMLKNNVIQLQRDYLHNCLLRGVKATAFVPDSQWFTRWQAECGVSMRKPNRKYKVPKAVLAERLEICWLNVARVRALCLAAHGYDPEIENWDQSPFHNNESGSANAPSLAVTGRRANVPLVEGHADTRERWTANLTTFSNKARIETEGPPYCEMMFKAEGDRLELRLREYTRSRGYGPWLSVATSPKGSYRTHDVLNFLDRHLPAVTGERRWRIMMADDYSAHLAPQIANLCRSRGYVFVAHGGGATPAT